MIFGMKQVRFGYNNIIKHPSVFYNIKSLPTLGNGRISKIKILIHMVKALFRYPGIFEYRIDVCIAGMTELVYLILTVPQRVREMRSKGKIVISKWAINPTDIYFGSGGVAMDPFYAAFCHMLMYDTNVLAIEGRSELSSDACPAQAAAYSALKSKVVEQDIFYPFIGPWCYDSQYCFEALKEKFNGYFGDQPAISNPSQKKMTKEHMVDELKIFFERLEKKTGVPYDPQRLREEIILENKLRRLCREINNMVLCDVIPLGSLDVILATFLSCDWLCDPIACLDMLTRFVEGLKKRQRKGVFARGVSKNPVRILVTGIAWGDLGLYNILDDLGGIVVASECVMSIYWEDIDEDPDKDPIEIMAERFINVPYTLGAKAKAQWTVDNIKRMKKIDGVIINSNFGCNYNAASTRIASDTIKEQTGVPVLTIDSDLPKESREQFRTRCGAFIEMIQNSRQGKKGI